MHALVWILWWLITALAPSTFVSPELDPVGESAQAGRGGQCYGEDCSLCMTTRVSSSYREVTGMQGTGGGGLEDPVDDGETCSCHC